MPNPYKEDITSWQRTGSNGYGGDTFAAPVARKGRWEERQEQFLNKDGEIDMSRAVVFFPQTVSVKPGDYLYLGTSSGADPTILEAYPIKAVVNTPDLRLVRREVRAIL